MYDRRDFLTHSLGVLGASALPWGINDAFGQSVPTGYKALVCINLDGGNDSWNMLIPSNPARHAEYLSARGGLYQGAPGALGIPISGGGGSFLPNALGLNGVEYALNPAMPELRTLFNQGRVSFLPNIGQLVIPTRKSTIDNDALPPQLFSHSDQARLWQQGSGNAPASSGGWGGGAATRLLSAPPATGLSPCISVSGQTRFLVADYPNGAPVAAYLVSDFDDAPAVNLEWYGQTDLVGAKRREILNRVLAQNQNDPFSREYATILKRSLALANTVNDAVSALGANPAFTAFRNALLAIPDTSIGRQLRQVARMIAISRTGQGPIQANRQIYYVADGGYDTHGEQIPQIAPSAGVWSGGHAQRLQELSQALAGFNAALLALNAVAGFSGVANEVIAFTTSEFARTLNSNGDGTDHAWGGVQLVMGAPVSAGGPLLGGQIIGRYPRITLDRTFAGAADAGGETLERGETIPTMAVDQLAATLTRWFGVSNAELPGLFPNIDNFASGPNANVMAFNGRTVPIISGI
jgi:uncharacterized protein (DUF1501 family)